MSGLVRDPWLWALLALVAVTVWIGIRRKRKRCSVRGETVLLPVRGMGRPR